MGLWEKIDDLNRSDMLPLHMPGHKRSDRIAPLAEVYAHDITEIDGFDDLHRPTGIIKNMCKKAASIYGADRAWISVNGSTAANEAAILAVCKPGDTVILPRASHRSVYYAIELGKLVPWYISTARYGDTSIYYPPTPDEVRGALRACPDCKCVIITSPTYEGLCADIPAIAEIVHAAGALLIVDSAHGGHITDMPDADIRVVSLHKMLPAPTQTSLLLMGRGATDRGVKPERISHYMDVFVSSSPSYVLMAGVDECLDYMETSLKSDLERTGKLLADMRNRCEEFLFTDISLISENSDPFKVVIQTKGGYMGGSEIYHLLREKYHIQCELAGAGFALALFSVMDEKEAFIRLSDALSDIEDMIDGELESGRTATREVIPVGADMYADHIPISIMIPGEAGASEYESVRFDESAIGRISASYVCIYPPGVPLIAPGEMIDIGIVRTYHKELERGLIIIGADNCEIPVLIQHE